MDNQDNNELLLDGESILKTVQKINSQLEAKENEVGSGDGKKSLAGKSQQPQQEEVYIIVFKILAIVIGCALKNLLSLVSLADKIVINFIQVLLKCIFIDVSDGDYKWQNMKFLVVNKLNHRKLYLVFPLVILASSLVICRSVNLLINILLFKIPTGGMN
jgi:hypothetical protein